MNAILGYVPGPALLPSDYPLSDRGDPGVASEGA